MKQDEETEEEGKKRGVSMERSKAGTKTVGHTAQLPNQIYIYTFYTLSGRTGKVVTSHAEGCTVARSNLGCG